MFSAETIRSAVWKSIAINFLTRIVGYVKGLIIIFLFGFSSVTDTFFLALGIIEFFLVIADVFDSVGVPNLVKRRENDREFKKLASTLFTFILILGIILMFFMFLVVLVIKLIVGNVASFQISSLGMYIFALMPYFFSMLLFHHFGAILRSKRRFTVFFIGELLSSVITVLSILLLFHFFARGIIIPISLSVGQVGALLFTIILCRQYLLLSWHWNDDMKLIVRQFRQLSVIYLCSTASNIVTRIFGMLLPVKSITALTYGSMVAMAPRGILRFESIFIVPLSEVSVRMAKIIHYSIFIFSAYTLVAFILFIFSNAFIEVLFGYGRATGLDIHLAAITLKYYSIGLPFLALSVLYYRIFQIADKLYILFKVGIISVVLLLFLNMLFFKFNYGIAGLALSASLVNIYFAIALCIMLIFHINKRVSMPDKLIQNANEML